MQKVKKILIVVGTRPNFIKVTQFKKVAQKYPQFEVKIVHTSQHYSDEMSQVFFNELNLYPDFYLNISNQLTPVTQMAEIMKELEQLIREQYYPDLMIVVGDVNSTLAGSIVANKMNILLAHLESGLRSFDNTMPEEYNRILTDKMAHYFFVTEADAVLNLKYEQISEDKIFYVGNTMIDTLVAYQSQIEESDILEKLKLQKKEYVLMTLHRPNNVDSEKGLLQIIHLLQSITQALNGMIKKLVFPIHPRTEHNFKKIQLWDSLTSIPDLILTQPQSYLHFQKLISYSMAVITDSGGVQEETTYLNIPCITLRPSTERPATMWNGTNILLPFDSPIVCNYLNQILISDNKKRQIPFNWNGHSTERIFQILSKILV